MNYQVEYLFEGAIWIPLGQPNLFEQCYGHMLSLSRANPKDKFRVKSINRLK